MDQLTKNQLSKEKNIKSKLVQTRKIIQSKFQRAYKNRIKNERKMDEKYRPITTAINKIHALQGKSTNLSAEPKAVKKYAKLKKFPQRRNFRLRSNHHIDSNSENPGRTANELSWDDFDNSLHALRTGVDNNNNLSSENLHSQHHDPPDVPILQHAYEFDNLDGAGPSGVRTQGPVDTAPQPHDESLYALSDSDIDEDAADDDTYTTAVNIEQKPEKRYPPPVKSPEKSHRKRVKLAPQAPAKRNLRSNTIISHSNPMEYELQSNKRYRSEDETRILHTIQKSQKRYKKRPTTPKGTLRRNFQLKDAEKAKKLINDVNEIKKARQRYAKSLIQNYAEMSSEAEDDEMEGNTHRGAGIETEFIPYTDNVAYEYYDDPNELCDRLRLLIASRAAGNTNHAQEINSLIAELRETGYVK